MKDKPFFARSVTRTAAFLTAACLALTCLAGCKGDAIAAAQPVNSVFSDSVATAAATAFHRTADAANRQNAPQSGDAVSRPCVKFNDVPQLKYAPRSRMSLVVSRTSSGETRRFGTA